MNSTKRWIRIFASAAALLLLLCAGCLEKRLVWSPDGQHAAVIGEDGLYLCDAEGHLSTLLVPNVDGAAWFSDSQRLVLSRRREARDWATLAPALGDARGSVEEKAESAWQALQAGGLWSVMSLGEARKTAIKICLRDRHAAELRAKLNANEWRQLEAEATELHELLLAHMDGAKVVVDTVRWSSASGLVELRPSPRGDAVVFAEEKPDSDDFDLRVIAVKGDAPAVVLSQRSAGYPDWTSDGNALVYIDAAATGDNDLLVLGVLVRRRVFDDHGQMAVADKPEYLAGMMFEKFAHVRCLRDGRILFNASELTLPLAAADYPSEQREQLFALDPARTSTLVRLIPRKHEPDVPQMLGFFDVSPDEREVVFGGMKGEVCVLTLATGEVRTVQGPADSTFQGAPMWRKPGELTYVRRVPEKDGVKPKRPAEVVLRRGDQEIVLSQSWSDEILAGVTKSTSK